MRNFNTDIKAAQPKSERGRGVGRTAVDAAPQAAEARLPTTRAILRQKPRRPANLIRIRPAPRLRFSLCRVAFLSFADDRLESFLPVAFELADFEHVGDGDSEGIICAAVRGFRARDEIGGGAPRPEAGAVPDVGDAGARAGGQRALDDRAQVGSDVVRAHADLAPGGVGGEGALQGVLQERAAQRL